MIKSRRIVPAILFALGILWAPLTSMASPYIAVDYTIEVSGHNWGIWMVGDVPSHDYMSRAFREVEWMNNGSDEKDQRPFYSYWALGFGPYGAIYLSNQLAAALLLISIILICFRVRKRCLNPRSPKASHESDLETNE